MSIGPNNNIRWSGPENASVYVQVDHGPAELFAAGASGTQAAPWMACGHSYVFILKDAAGKKIAHERADLR